MERENGKSAWLLGACFITEGAIPFAAADPFRIIPSVMAGSAVTGGLSMACGATLRAPHGSIFVVPLIGNPLLYLLAIIAGTVESAVLVVALKSAHRTRTVTVASTVGLHARPAALFAAEAARQSIPVTVGKPGAEPVDARSVLSVLTLDVRHGDEVVLSAGGTDAEAALDALEELLQINHDA